MFWYMILIETDKKRAVKETQSKQSVLGVKEMKNRSREERALAGKVLRDWKKTRKVKRREKGVEIHLQFEVEVASGAFSNPVCLHGFDPVPLWKVLQGVQEGLKEIKPQVYYFVQVWKELIFHFTVEKRYSY